MLKNDEIIAIAREFVRYVVAADYSAIANRTSCQRLSADEIRDEIQRYPYKFVLPPNEKWPELVHSTPVAQSNVEKSHVQIDLWTSEEGRSDLSVLLWLTKQADDHVAIELENIEVL